MRKLFLLFWALLATTCLWAHDFEVDGIYYNHLGGNNVAVTYKGNYYYDSNEYFGEVSIPESVTYDGITYNVTSIGKYAFRDCSSLTSITISNGVTSVGVAAFDDCSSLTSITIPESVTSIGESAFQRCSSLTSITIPNSVTSIGNYAFYGCSSLTSMVVEIGNTIYDSRDNCNAIIETATNTLFIGCGNSTIPNSVTSIGENAFYHCSSLTSITIPNSVTSIGESAFYSCFSLTSVTIPNSVTSIGSWAFDGCSSLTSINIPNSITTIGEYVFFACSSLTSITIPNSLTSISDYAFCRCSSLSSITIPNNVTSIGYRAFYECSSLTSITIPNSVTSIGEDALKSCSKVTMQGTTPPKITAITFNNNATFFVPCSAMDDYLAAPVWQFLDLHGLSHHVALNATEGGSAQITATNCESNSVTIEATPAECNRFKQWSDGNTDNPRTLTLTCDITLTAEFDVTTYSVSITAGEGGYLEYGNIEREYNECNREWIYNCAYPYDGYYFVGWSDGNTYNCIEIYPYEDINLVAQFAPKQQVTVLVGVDNASKDMGSVSGSGIYYSGDYVTISATPNTGYHFVEWNDGNGNATRELYLQSDTTLFATFAPGEYGGKCGDNLYWTYSDNTITITGSGAMNLYEYPAWKQYYDYWYYYVTDVQFPEGITSIDNSAFSEMSLTSVVVPASVTYFGENAFAYNYNLTRFEYLGTEAYYDYFYTDDIMLHNCPNLRYFKGQTEMLSYTSGYLDTVIITSGNMYDDFYSTTYVDNSNASDTYFGEGYLQDDVLAVETLLLPNGLLEIGDFALHNARHLEQITIPAGVTRIGESAFEECRSLDSVTFAGTALREIDDWAFYNCHSLKDITIPEGVTSIGKAAFFDCSHLNELTLPSTVQTIEDNAFGQCAQVKKMNVKAAVPPVVESETFEDIDRSIQVLVPQGTLKLYREAPYWQEFFNIAESEVMAGVENTMTPSTTTNCQKIIRDGNLVIIRDGVEYNVMGQQL